MLKFGVRNIRRLKEVSPIDLRRVTVLVGRNSSGKSTFLRMLPLLRQSVTTRTSTPILWFGDLVDFGSYAKAVSDNNTASSIAFAFEVDNVSVRTELTFFRMAGREAVKRDYENVGLEVQLRNQSGRSIESLQLTLEKKERFVLQIGSDSIVKSMMYEGQDLLPLFGKLMFAIDADQPFPSVTALPPPTGGNKKEREYALFNRWQAMLVPALADEFGYSVAKDEDDEAFSDFANAILDLQRFDANSLIEVLAKTQHPDWAEKLTLLVNGSDKERWLALRRIWVANQCMPTINEVCSRLKGILADVLYVGPARATSQRYYRYQDLAVSEIDPDGKNFAMFLNSLYPHQLEHFSQWVKSLFNYGVSVKAEGGHISVELTVDDANINIVDTGYGVSQVLPVLGQIWWAINRSVPSMGAFHQSATTTLVAIEQPELHLHPAHQALIADALAVPPGSQSFYGDRDTRFVVETHSETLINRLGQLVAEGRLAADDLQIAIFEADESDPRKTIVAISEFGEAGELINWPYGFFQAGS